MITALTPQKIYKQMARGRMITAKGVKTGINPAPTGNSGTTIVMVSRTRCGR